MHNNNLLLALTSYEQAIQGKGVFCGGIVYSYLYFKIVVLHCVHDIFFVEHSGIHENDVHLQEHYTMSRQVHCK